MLVHCLQKPAHAVNKKMEKVLIIIAIVCFVPAVPIVSADFDDKN
jgi:hypothetical protein